METRVEMERIKWQSAFVADTPLFNFLITSSICSLKLALNLRTRALAGNIGSGILGSLVIIARFLVDISL